MILHDYVVLRALFFVTTSLTSLILHLKRVLRFQSNARNEFISTRLVLK